MSSTGPTPKQPPATGAPAWPPSAASKPAAATEGAKPAGPDQAAAKPAARPQPAPSQPGGADAKPAQNASAQAKPAAPKPAQQKAAQPNPAPPGDAAGQPAAASKPAAKPAPKPAGPQAAKPAGPTRGPAAPQPTKAPASPSIVAATAQVRPPASRARLRGRHVAILFSFLIMVAAPVALAAWYLTERAADRYASYVGFSVRSESEANPLDALGTLSGLGLGSNSSSDTEILYKFLQSHEMVERLDRTLDLREIWSSHPEDPVFNFDPDGSLEDLLAHWRRMVSVSLDNGMLDLRVVAYSPADAQRIAEAILTESQRMVNDINDVARADAMRYAQADLDYALERLKKARQAVSRFRNDYQMVDPSADIAGQAGLQTTLEQQLAEALIQLGILEQNASGNDPRLEQARLRIKVIREQIDQEKAKVGSSNADGLVLSELVGEYEALQVDRQFAESAYTAALAASEASRAEAQRQSRYLAAYVRPTLAERAEFPERGKILGLLSAFLLLGWLIAVMTYYSIRNRR